MPTSTHELIAETRLTTTAATIDFTGLPNSYTDFIIEARLQGTQNCRPMIYINTFSDLYIYYGSGMNSQGSHYNINYPRWEPMYNIATTYPFAIRARMFNVNNSSQNTTMETVAGQGISGFEYSHWRYQNNAIVSQMQFKPSGGSWAAGSLVRIYGVI